LIRKKIYFGDRVLAREQSPYEKTLDLLAVDERRVVIVDDAIDIWPHHNRNLLQISKYIYFSVGIELLINIAEDKIDESRSNGSLAHKRFKKVSFKRPETVDT